MNDFISPSTGLWFIAAVIVFVFVCGGLIFYALRSKGDVFAELKHGATSFKLQAKERPPAKKLH